MTADPFDERNIPTTTRRRELADRIGTWRLYYGGDLFWALVIVALFVIGAIFVGNVVRAEAIDDTAATVHEVADRPDVEHPKPGWLALTGCDLAEWHAEAAGLPVPLFRHIAEAESGCRNDITNRYGPPCCHGGWQIHQLWLVDPVVQACGATDIASLRTDTPESWAVNACAAAYILEVQGLRAWQVCTKRIVRCW